MSEENIQKNVDETWKEKAKAEVHDSPPQTQGKDVPQVDFKFLVSTLGMQAWIALGGIANPVTGKIEENLNQVKFIVDALDVLTKKTKGNLDKEESDVLENLLYELRLAYVNKVNRVVQA